MDGTATSVDAHEPVQQWCEDDALLYWIEEFNKLRNDKSVVQAFQCIQQSESIHPLLRGFVNNGNEWDRADGKYKLLPVVTWGNVLLEMPYHVEEVAARGALALNTWTLFATVHLSTCC